MEKEIMMILGADWNGSDNIDDCPFSERMIVETTEPVVNFTKSEVYSEKNEVKFYHRPEFQIAKGLQRGDLFVADFGEKRLVAFTGQGAILEK